VDQAAPETARATVALLKRLGHTIAFPKEQTCCGQALFNMGFRREARALAIRFIHLFGDAEAVVAPSGSCVSMVVKHYGELDLPSAETAVWESLRGRVFELCSFLVDRLGVRHVGAVFPHTVAYHSSCHIQRELGVREQPLELLSAVHGLQLVTGGWGDECCGFGGGFSVKYQELSRRIADRRIGALITGGEEYITGADDSCLHNLGEAIKRRQGPQKIIHIARILASTVGDK